MENLKITQLSEKNYHVMASIAPAHALDTASIVLSCTIDGIIIGTSTLMRKDKDWALTWIFLIEDFRNQGIGNKLLDASIDAARANGGRNLEVAIEGIIEEGTVLTSMLADRDFFINFNADPYFFVTKNQLQEALFYTHPEILSSKKLSSETMVPLRNVKADQLRRFIHQREKRHNYLASRADYSSADQDLSMLLILDSEIVGTILVNRIDKGKFALELCFIERNYLLALLRLMRKVSDHLLSIEETIDYIEFACSNEAVLKAAQRLLPEHTLNHTGIITGWLRLQ